jgi:transcriptional regulator GlxA family with amidase domain
VGIQLFEQVEPLDFAGPYEVLACSRDAQGAPRFKVSTLAPAGEVVCMGGLRVLADHLLHEAPPLDILIAPGGPGAREPVGDPEPVLAFLRDQAPRLQVLASVCTGSYWLARAGLLDGLSATTHSLRLADFAEKFPAVRVVGGKVVDQGAVITAGGVASGIDLGLHLLERFHGPDARRREAVRLDGPWI